MLIPINVMLILTTNMKTGVSIYMELTTLADVCGKKLSITQPFQNVL